MEVAKIQTSDNRKKMTIVLTAAVLLTGLVVAFLLITLTKLKEPQTVQKRAAEPVPTSAPDQACLADGVCSWEYTEKGVTFKYEIRDTTKSEPGTVVKSGETPDTRITFPVFADHSYKCIVTVTNECGDSPTTTATNTCKSGEKPSPTPTGVITTTPTRTPTPNPSASVTPTNNPSVTPSPTTHPSITPTPSEIVIVVTSVTPSPTTLTTQPPTKAPVSPPTAGILWPSVALVVVGIFIVMLGFVL